MQQSTLNQLVILSCQNNTNAFRKIVEAHQEMVYVYVFRILCHDEDALDITQETFIRVWKHLKRYTPEKKFTTWLFAIATNLCYDHLRKNRHKNIQNSDFFEVEREYFFTNDNPEIQYENKDLLRIISSLTLQLTPKQKIVFTLKDLQGFEVTEIVAITGMSAKKKATCIWQENLSDKKWRKSNTMRMKEDNIYNSNLERIRQFKPKLKEPE